MSIETTANLLTYLGKTSSSPDFGQIQSLQPICDQLVKEDLGFWVEQQQFTEWYPDRHLSRMRDELVDSAPYEMVGGRAVQYGMLGLNAQVIQLRQLPVRQIISLYENPGAWNVANPPSFPADSLLTEGLDFILDFEEADNSGTKISWTGEVYRLTGAWYISPWSGRSIQVTYTAGFSQDELQGNSWPAFFSAVRLASCITVAAKLKEIQAQMGDSVGTTVTGTSGGATAGESIGGYSVSYNGEAALNNLGFELALPRAAKRLLEPYRRMTKMF